MRASVVVVIGDREANGGVVQADDGLDGSRHALPAADLAQRMADAHADRRKIEW